MRRYQYLLLACLFLFAFEASAQPTASFNANKTTCFAPCGVVFETVGAGTNPATTDGGTANAFHDLFYHWDFGNPSAGSWTYYTSNSDKNIAFGPIAGHLYENAGTYTVTLMVLDDGGNTDTATETITVTDPDSDFTLANTYCYANTAGTFQGCLLDAAADGDSNPGDGTCDGTNSANCVVCSDVGTSCINANLGANTRHQMAEGDTWTGTVSLGGVSGPGFVESFNSNTPAGSFERPIIGNPSVDSHGFNFNGASDWTLTRLGCDGPDSTPSTQVVCLRNVSSSQSADNITVFDFDVVQMNQIMVVSGNISSNLFVQQANISNKSDQVAASNGWSFIVYAHDSAFVGNDVNNDGEAEGNFRLFHAQRSVMSNNRMRRPGLAGGGGGGTTLTMRSCDAPVFGCSTSTTPHRYVVVSENLMDSGVDAGGSAIEMQNQNGENLLQDIIVERNLIYCSDTACGGGRAIAGRAASNGFGQRITLRNNAIHCLHDGGACGLVHMTGSTAGEVDDWWIYNNSIHSLESIASIDLVNLPEGDAIVRNNLIHMPNATTKTLTAGGASFTTSNNLIDDASPVAGEYCGDGSGCDPFVAATGIRDTAAEFALTGSVASGTNPADNGFDFSVVDPHVYIDIISNCRPEGSDWDVGAHELNAINGCFPSFLSGGSLGGGIQ